MPSPKVFTGVVYQNRSATMLARVVGKDFSGSTVTGEGKQVQQADLSTITCAVYILSDETTAIITPAITISAVIFNALQTPAIWTGTVDATGYNFDHTLPITAFPTGAKRYRVEYKFTTTGSTTFTLAFEVDALRLLAS